MAEKVRAVFIYLAFIAIILGSIGTLMLTGDITGEIVKNEEKYSLSEVEEHNNERDCWISFNDKVYDITLFLQVYPEDLSGKCGRVVSVDSELKKVLEEYQIGIVK